ncbi:MAG: transcription-repair coupling factor [Burkholderiaceae bacterium]
MPGAGALAVPPSLDALRWPKPGKVFRLPGAHGSSDALMIAALASRSDRAGPLAVLAASATEAARLDTEIRFYAPRLRVALLPDWETLPYDTLSPHQDLVSERLATLYALQRSEVDVLLVSASTGMHRLAPASFLASYTFFFKQGQALDEQALRAQLVRAGYEHVSQVIKPGEYSVRGGILDLFPMGAALPFRIDLFGDEIESIKTFDPDSQRSLYPVTEVRLLPSREVPADEAARTAFRGRWRERFEGDPSRCGLYRDIGNGIFGAGIEYYLPLFHDSTDTLFDYLPPASMLLFHGDVQRSIGQLFASAAERATSSCRMIPSARCCRPGKSCSRPSRCSPVPGLRPVFPCATAARALRRPPMHEAAPVADQPFATGLPDVAIDRRAAVPPHRLQALLAARAAHTGRRLLVIAESAGRLETLHQLFTEHGLRLPQVDDFAHWQTSDEPAAFCIGPLHDGFELLEQDTLVITESELFAGTVRRNRRTGRGDTTDVNSIIRDLSELKIGDPVVHSDHGIGRYQGLIDLDMGEGVTEFLHLTYARGTQLYVPVSQLHLISRYSGSNPDEAPLHQLGSGQWEKARRKAARQARDTAAELLNLYARRASRVGHSYPFNVHDYEAFAEGFGFEETPDQLAAIHAVIQDMVSDKPMDRLVCGDVGFGKTEVALRAAFVAVSGGHQVVLLSPTTLLAEHHFETFRSRMADWPIQIAQLSRFRSPKEVQAAIEGLANGQVDIVIGTHKLLSENVKLKRLGLIIIDEEHRFGVRQKERLKAMRAEVDVLTLTATPIPRTLAMSLEGIRDFSVIATAPQRRLAIKTFVRTENKGIIREALLREIKRGGQVYFLHNEVQTIENRRQELAELIPEARIAVAHGQMGERDLERVMRDFHQQRFNVLLCTTIIETGIDVPSANTIVIHRADRFGLGQLHQLRGRVGRSHHQAYASLMTPGPEAITKDATKRLEAIQSMEELGSGFYLAMHDLEIRGAGEVLGESQSGDMQEVGFSMYTQMLDEAVRALKAGREPDLESPLSTTTEIKLHVPALLPADYCPDVHERLTLYKRLANCDDEDGVIRLQEELIDRFGRLPEAAVALVATHRLRVITQALGIAKIDAAEELILMQFIKRPPIEPAAIIAFMQARRDTRLAGEDRLRIETRTPDLAQRIQRIREILAALTKEAERAAKKVKSP